MALKYIEEAEKRAELARQKYGAQTMGELLSRIIIYTLIGYIIIVFICIILYLSPADDRILSTVLLVFVLCEMLTEYALWAFTYQGMRKTEAPLQDLQKFSTITKEGWRRAEMVLDWTAPIFAWVDDIVKRSGLDWRKKQMGEEPPKTSQTSLTSQTSSPPAVDYGKLMVEFTGAMHDVTERLARLEESTREARGVKKQ